MKDRSCLNNIIKVCSKTVGALQSDLNFFWEKSVFKKARNINYSHLLFTLMPSGRRHLLPPRRMNHYSSSFILSAIRLLKAEWLPFTECKDYLNVTLFCTNHMMVAQVNNKYIFAQFPRHFILSLLYIILPCPVFLFLLFLFLYPLF